MIGVGLTAQGDHGKVLKQIQGIGRLALHDLLAAFLLDCEHFRIGDGLGDLDGFEGWFHDVCQRYG